MPEICQFEIHKAEMTLEGGVVTAKLYYPRNPRLLESRLKENLSFGISVFEKLINQGYSEIANNKNPIGPPAAGSLYILEDDMFICNRRGISAPTHKLYHSAYAGFPGSIESIFTKKGLVQTGLRETAEESLLITKEKSPRLIVPNDSKELTLASAKNLELNLKPLYVDVDILEPTDKLEVYYEDGEFIFSAKAFLDLAYESATLLNALQIRRVPLSSEEILPIDAEGTTKDGKFFHFNRESYIINFNEIANKLFGFPLENSRVFQTKIENGFPRVFIPSYERPYLGPDKIEVTSPHIWSPDNLLISCLDALGIEGYKGKKFEIELWKERTKSEGKSLVPKSVLSG